MNANGCGIMYGSRLVCTNKNIILRHDSFDTLLNFLNQLTFGDEFTLWISFVIGQQLLFN